MTKVQALQPGEMVQLMQSRPVQLGILLINLLLVAWIAWMLARLTLDLLDTDGMAEEPLPVTAVAEPVRENNYRTLVKQMPAWRLMGEAKVEVAAPVKSAAPVNAPETRLKLTLRGAFASDDPDYARAIIADQRGQEEMYALGDKVPGNAELSEILVDRVILMRSGRYETLSLPEEAASGSTGKSTVRNRRPSQADRLRSLRNTLKQNPKSLYGLVRTTPKRDADGKMIGYTLQPGRDPDLFSSMGLQAGDVVTRVNDVALSDLSSGMRALKSAQGGDSVTLTVMRGGQEETLSINVPQ
jgi:general secretion pathway protein C